jgi:SNF2 family DNA or RNA helicase
MLVIEGASALALKLTRPERVLATIPTSRLMSRHDGDLTVVPHRLDEVRVLRNLGISAPSPILHYYNWPGKFVPFAHQKETAAFLTLQQRGLVLNEIGTGKTQSALWAADYLMNIGQAKRVLIISPLSTLERVWADGIFKSLFHRKFVTLYGTASRRKALLNTDAEFFIINHDGFEIIANDSHGMFDVVIVDEAAVLRNPSTRRYKILKRYMDANPDTRLWMMTGTPTPNAPTDAWSLATLVKSPLITKTFGAFRDNTMTKHGLYKWMPRAEAPDIVKNVLQPSIRYTRDECFDLPTTMFQTRKVELTVEQKKAYKQMLNHLVAEPDAGSITAINEAIKVQKLIQIGCGVAYGEGGKYIELDCAPRVAATAEVIEQAGGKVIVFVPLTGTLHMLNAALAKQWPTAVVNGAVPAGQRNEIFRRFQDPSDELRVLVAHPATMAHGLTLTEASTVIWYGPIYSNEQYTQANGRVERIGKHHVTNVVHIEATAIESKLFQRLRDKQQLQGMLLDLIQQMTKEK